MAALQGLIKKLTGEDEEDPAPLGMPGSASQPNTGVSGGLDAIEAPPMQADAPAAAKPLLGSYANRLEGFDTGKLNDASYTSPKYAIGRALSGFDPRQGVTDDVLKALNSGGAGQQYTRLSGDKVRGQDGRVVDLVRGFNDPNGTGGWQLGLEGNAPAQRSGGMPSFAGSTISPMLQSDAQGNIQSALGALQQPGLLQRLIAQLQGGQ
jgi:hypothetical protein